MKISMYLHAEEVLEEIDACCVILTRSVHAHANVVFAIHAGPPFGTGTFVPAYLVATSSAVEARIREAIVDVHFAGRASVAFSTVTQEFII